MFPESFYIPIICMLLGAVPEARLPYDYPIASATELTNQTYVRADCVSATHAIEVGFADKRSARDSLQQALFYAEITELQPMIVLIDRSRGFDSVEYQITTTARRTGVRLQTYKEDFLLRLAMTSHFRAVRKKYLGMGAGG